VARLIFAPRLNAEEANPAVRYIFCAERQHKRMPLPSGLGYFVVFAVKSKFNLLKIIGLLYFYVLSLLIGKFLKIL
jgi:hypothetical protein